MVTLAMLTAFTAQWAATDYTERRGASDLASALDCHAQPGDVLWLNNDFPYDLPFLRNAQTPMQVAQDWPGVLSSAGDNWMRELAEGAAFDQAAAAKILRTPAELQQASHLNNQWLVISNRAGLLNDVINDGWQPVFKGRTWMLLQSASPDKSPVTAQEKGLNRCQPHGNHQAEQIRP